MFYIPVCENENCQMKTGDIFSYFAQNMNKLFEPNAMYRKQMSLQLKLSSKFLVTHFANKFFLASMSYYVLIQGSFLAKSEFTHRTFIGPLSRMSSFMLSDVGRSPEHFLAVATR